MNEFQIFNNKKVLITGHTGFKGTWMSLWLKKLGAKVYGVSNSLPSEPSNFKAIEIEKVVRGYDCDVRDLPKLQKVFADVSPDFVFHLAAQALVKYSYDNPIETWSTNVVGTLNVLECVRGMSRPTTLILITSDKAYENNEWVWGYRENDKLGGIDPYSSSKAAAELAISSFVKSYFPKEGYIRIGIGRAGNVIGGGDWAADRIVPDCVKAWSMLKCVQIRNPAATRPWQHVLEPISGYLALASRLNKQTTLHGEAFNFGPSIGEDRSVTDLVRVMSQHWEAVNWEEKAKNELAGKESGLLQLNCDKAQNLLGWRPTWNFEQTVEKTALWYKTFYTQCSGSEMQEFALEQINDFTSSAREARILWAQ